MRILFPALLLIASSCTAQSTDALAKTALTHLQANLAEIPNYTYLDTEHDHSFIDGKFNQDRTVVSETIELEGAPYSRQLSVNGKPLAGKDLEREEAMYNEAIRQRRSVDSLRPAKHFVNHQANVDLSRLTLDYTARIVGHETIAGHACDILLFEPKLDVTPAPTSKHTIWVDPVTGDVLRFDRQLVAQEGRDLPGSTYSIRFALTDKVFLRSEDVSDVTWDEPKIQNRRIHLIATHTYTNYRRFRATVTIGPASLAPDQP